MAQLHPQEIFLLEYFSSVEYLRKVRDAWKAFVEHNERCLDEFMHHLPTDLRRRHVSRQGDIVWNSVVMPNFRATLAALEQGCIELANGDPSGYWKGGGVSSDFKGQLEYDREWMSEEDQGIYSTLISAALKLDNNFGYTIMGTWDEGNLTYGYAPEAFGPLDLPARIPRYQLDESVQMNTGEEIPMTGIYLPEARNAAARFIYIIPSQVEDAPEVTVWTEKDEYGDLAADEWQSTRWTLVRRVEGEFIDVPPEGFFPENSLVTGRCEANHRCPGTGYWWTPACENSRRRFEEGEIMPEFPDSQYGSTIWYWDQQQ